MNVGARDIELRARVTEAMAHALKTARQMRGMSLRELAFAVNMSTSHLAKLESGDQSMTGFHIYVLSEALDVTADDLMPLLGNEL